MPGEFYYGSYNTKYIAIGDDGHGLDTAGKRTPVFPNGTVIKENSFNHAVKIKFFSALKRCKIGAYDVSPERSDTSLYYRTLRANNIIKKNSDLKRVVFISFHYNAYDGKWDTNKGGLSVYHYPGAVAGGNKLAKHVHKYLKQGTKQLDRGILTANFHVLRETRMAAILTENGFMDVRYEAALMLNENFQKEVAEETCKGVCSYFGVKYINPSTHTKGLYKVQVGVFKEKSNAEKLIKKMKKDNFYCFLTKVGSLYKVQAGAFREKSNANKLVDQLKKYEYDSFITFVK